MKNISIRIAIAACLLAMACGLTVIAAASGKPAGGPAVPGRGPASDAAANPFGIYEGVYRLPDGNEIVISRVGVVEEMARPCFLDWQTGRFGYLGPKGTDGFVAAASSTSTPDAPPQTEILFLRGSGGGITGLAIREAGLAERRAFRTTGESIREATFRNGSVAFAATLRVPEGKGPFPAVVLVHGSGPGERTQVSLMTRFFSRLGLAVLAYDKRGCGGSGGDWKNVDLDTLAEDALAGVRWLKTQSGIDPRRVGLWGISQGGWITPLAASLSADPAFAVNSSGPATSLRRQDTFMMANTLKAEGFTDDEIARVITALETLYDYGRGKATAEALDTVMNRIRSDPRLKEMAFPPAAEISPEALYARQRIGDPAWFFHLNPDNDALTPYRKRRCPILVTYGKLDYTVPVEESVGLLGGIAREPGAPDLTVEVISDSGHGYLRMQENDPRKPVEPMVISRRFFEAMEKWLRARGFAD